MPIDVNHNVPHMDPASSPKFVTGTPDWVKPIIERAAAAKNIPSMVLSALLKQESGFNINARSPVGAQGIAQFMPGTAKGMGVNPLDPESAIMGAAQYLRNGLDKFGGKMDLALAAYNAGSGAVQHYQGIPPYKETQNYVKNILGMAGQDHATANQPAMDVLAQQRKNDETPNMFPQGGGQQPGQQAASTAQSSSPMPMFHAQTPQPQQQAAPSMMQSPQNMSFGGDQQANPFQQGASSAATLPGPNNQSQTPDLTLYQQALNQGNKSLLNSLASIHPDDARFHLHQAPTAGAAVLNQPTSGLPNPLLQRT